MTSSTPRLQPCCKWLFAAALSGALLSCGKAPDKDSLVVYSARNEQLIKPLFDQYTAETGTKIAFVTDSAGPLLQRLQAEGKNTPADILLTVDAGNLWQAADSGLLQSVNSTTLEQAIPKYLRDPENRWFGLSVRARTLVYSTERVKPAELQGYAELAEPQWRGRLCLRTSKKVYNQSLVAMLMSQYGEAKTEQIVKGWVNNLATAPFSNDTKAMEAIMAGQCDVAIVNSYYFGRLEKDQPDLPLALFWADQAGAGVHVNVSGAGVTAASNKVSGATNLIEWLASAEAQKQFAGDNLEFPANPAVEPVATVRAWGKYKPNVINVADAGELQADAVKLMDRAGYK